VAEDIGVDAVKIGMLHDAAVVREVAAAIRRHRFAHVVLDPVMVATSGDRLIAEATQEVLVRELFPLATLVTPNLDEVHLLVGIDVIDAESQRAAAKALHALGPRWALVKGGHLRSSQRSCDLLYDGADFYEFDSPRLLTGDDHGGGDTLAAAVACALASGYTVPDAVGFGKRWVTECLRAAYPLGRGHGPVSPLFRLS
jgi:hydroxymethylpyrimidine/phosphomethylpyrimidine kinase